MQTKNENIISFDIVISGCYISEQWGAYHRCQEKNQMQARATGRLL